jgi:DNA replication protein DnaC
MPSLAEDYEKNGLLYCGNCNTPKQAYIEGFGRNMPIPCKCRKEKEEAEKEREKLLKKQARITALRNASLLGARYSNATFENTETEHSIDFAKIYNRCQRYCEVADAVLKNGTGIYLFGTKGTGKSRLTACMGNKLMQNNYTVLYTNFAEITKRIFKDDDFIDKLSKIEFLFIDDFGTEKVTKGSEDMWLQEKVFEVINKRYNEIKPIIFTSNYSLKELIEDRGVADKTIDRIAEMCEVMRLEGKSYRMTAMNKREKLF